jgi:hypothetical protein
VTPRLTAPDGVAPVAALAALLVVAGGLVAAVNSAAPFAHGSWLAAYLVLVGGVSQLALAAGPPLVLPAPRHSATLRRAQLVAWNAGAGIVAVGVLADSVAVVVVGSVGVLVALACFALAAGPSRPGHRAGVLAYRAVIALLGVSVVIGCVLAST